jgi:hypothetical protein
MTKKERAAKIKQSLVAELLPHVGGKLFIEVHALSKDCLLVEAINARGPGRQVFVKVRIAEPDAVKKFHDLLTRDPDPNCSD